MTDCLINTKCPLWYPQRKTLSWLILWPMRHNYSTGKLLIEHENCFQTYCNLIKNRLEVRSLADPHVLMCEPCQMTQRQELVFLICWPDDHLERKKIFPAHLHESWVEYASNSPTVVGYAKFLKFVERFANSYMDRLINRLFIDLATLPIFESLKPNCFLPINPESSWVKRPFDSRNRQPGLDNDMKKLTIYNKHLDVEQFLKAECFINKKKCTCFKKESDITSQKFEKKLKGFLSNKESFLSHTDSIEKTFQILNKQKCVVCLDYPFHLESRLCLLRNNSNESVFDININFQFEDTAQDIVNNIETETLFYYHITDENHQHISAAPSRISSEKNSEPIPGPSTRIEPPISQPLISDILKKPINKRSNETETKEKDETETKVKKFKKSNDPSKYKNKK